MLETSDTCSRRDPCAKPDHHGTVYEAYRFLCGQVLSGTFLASLLLPSLNDASLEECMLGGYVATEPRWQIGMPNGIKLHEVKVVGAIHVSAGSWMPIIQLTQHII